jgi:hypothetical protein
MLFEGVGAKNLLGGVADGRPPGRKHFALDADGGSHDDHFALLLLVKQNVLVVATF